MAIVDLDQYQDFLRYKNDRAEFFDWLDKTATINAEHNKDLSEEEILAIIDQARQEVWEEQQSQK